MHGLHFMKKNIIHFRIGAKFPHLSKAHFFAMFFSVIPSDIWIINVYLPIYDYIISVAIRWGPRLISPLISFNNNNLQTEYNLRTEPFQYLLYPDSS